MSYRRTLRFLPGSLTVPGTFPDTFLEGGSSHFWRALSGDEVYGATRVPSPSVWDRVSLSVPSVTAQDQDPSQYLFVG